MAAPEGPLRPIAEVLTDAQRATEAARVAGGGFGHQNRHKREREAWVLGHFAALYNAWGGREAEIAIAQGGDSPAIPADFAIFDPAGRAIAHVEVTVALDPGRRPGAERLGSHLVPDPQISGIDPWGHLAEVLAKKVAKGAARYASPTWLVVYVNVFAGMYGDRFDPLVVAERTLAGLDLGATGLTEVWLLESNAQSAMRAYPGQTLLGGG